MLCYDISSKYIEHAVVLFRQHYELHTYATHPKNLDAMFVRDLILNPLQQHKIQNDIYSRVGH